MKNNQHIDYVFKTRFVNFKKEGFIMKVKYILEDLDCANCAAKMEEEISKLDGVNSVNVSFISTKMTLELADENADEILSKIEKIVKKIEPDVKLKKI